MVNKFYISSFRDFHFDLLRVVVHVNRIILNFKSKSHSFYCSIESVILNSFLQLFVTNDTHEDLRLKDESVLKRHTTPCNDNFPRHLLMLLNVF